MRDQKTGHSAYAPTERKQITAVFVDIVGFSALVSRADPEDLQRRLEAFYAQTAAIMSSHDGEVTEYLGDGVLALFGHDPADELAASKAVTAAMTVLDEVRGEDADTPLQLRIGVATGEAALRTLSARDNRPRATGLVTTLARRIQERAAPGTVMIAESTRRLLRGAFATETFAGETLKGFSEPQTLYRPRPGPAFAPATQHRFVGRATAIKQIKDSAQATLVIGEAGIGKTALVRHLAETAPAASVFQADGVQMRSVYLPFSQWLSQVLGADKPTYGRLQARFSALPDSAKGALALVLGLPEGQRLLAEHSNVALGNLIAESLWMAIRATQTQGMLIFEDLQWLDNASFDVLSHIIKSKAAAHYQIMMTSRDDDRVMGSISALPVTTLRLKPLSDHDAAEMLSALSDGMASANQKASIIAKAGGIPLFIEQIYRRDSGRTGVRPDVPATLKDLLASQIDTTGPAKPILQCAAVIGRQFDLSMLRAIAPGDVADVTTHLALACKQGVLRQIGPTNWAFAHALLQETAYNSMARQIRIAYHRQFAAHLQEHCAEDVARNPAQLTTHLALSQQYTPAIAQYLNASQTALFQGAFADAEAHALAAISLCNQAPDDLDTAGQEITAHTLLGAIRMQTQGFTAPPVKEAYETVARLAARQNGFIAANGPAFNGSFTHAVISGDKLAAVRFSDMLRATADAAGMDVQASALRMASLNTDTALHFYTGAFSRASAAFGALQREYDITRHRTMISCYGADPYAAAQMFECVTRAICGDAHLVPGMLAETDAHQDRLNMPVMQPWAMIWGAVPLYYAGLTDTALARLRKGLRISDTQQSAFWQATGAAWLHVIDTAQTYAADGLASFHSIIKTHESMGAHIGLPYFRAHYAAALARHDRVDAAYENSLQAVRDNQANGMLCWYPEILRLHARICDLRGGARGAARFRHEAATIATRQGAHLWLLRTRLDQRQADEVSDDALRAVLSLFPAQVRTPDIHKAQQLLAHS